jgi:hypothetical protein
VTRHLHAVTPSIDYRLFYLTWIIGLLLSNLHTINDINTCRQVIDSIDITLSYYLTGCIVDVAILRHLVQYLIDTGAFATLEANLDSTLDIRAASIKV